MPVGMHRSATTSNLTLPKLETTGIDLDHLHDFAQQYSTKEKVKHTLSFKDLRPVPCEEFRPDDWDVVTFDDVERIAIGRYRVGDRLAAKEDAIVGPLVLQKGDKGTIVKGAADFRRGAIVQWDESPHDILGRVAPGQFAYKGHGILPTEKKKENARAVRKESIICSVAWLKRTESCRWPTTPVRDGKEVPMISGLPNARLKLIPGLLSNKKCISIEIALRPDHFICAAEEPPYARVKWRPEKGTVKASVLKEFDETASWQVVKRDKGLYVAFESMFRPGWFLSANTAGATITMERIRIAQNFKDNTTMVVTEGSEPENWRSIEKVDAYAVGDDTVGVKWFPDVGPVRIWSKTPVDEEWEELETTHGYNKTATVIRGIDFVTHPHLFLVAPMHRRHFFVIALVDNLFKLIGAKPSSEWVKHPGFLGSTEAHIARRNALTGEEFHGIPQNLLSLKQDRKTVSGSESPDGRKTFSGSESPDGRKTVSQSGSPIRKTVAQDV